MAASENGRTFLDTNVLVYLFDRRDPAKRERARALFQASPSVPFVISTQVLGEFYWTATRKLPRPLDDGTAEAAVERFSRFGVVAVDRDLVRSAIRLSRSASISYWDALLVRAASVGSCGRILTEDLNHGQLIDGVRIENPFVDG